MKTNNDIQKAVNQQEEQMRRIDDEAKKGKRKWTLIMLVIVLVELGIAAGVAMIGMEYAPYALIFAIISVAITAKLCVAQMGKVLERQRSEREKMDTSGRFARFNWDK